MAVIDELPENLSKIKLPPSLSTNDFKKISYEDYQQMNEAEKASISTVCKILNSQNEEELKQWLPTIPDEELVFIPLIKNKNSLEFKVTVLQRLPQEHQLETLHELDSSNQSILTQCLEKPELFKMILALYPTDESRLKALKKTLMRAISKPESLKILLELLPETQRHQAVTEKNNKGDSILRFAASNPKCLNIILEFLPKDISEVIQVCKKNLDPNDFEKSTFSMLDFMTDMEGLATPEAINHFVHAVIDNQGIEQALNELFSPEPSNSFFKSSSREAIQECMNKLDRHWLDRVPKLEQGSKIIKPLKKA